MTLAAPEHETSRLRLRMLRESDFPLGWTIVPEFQGRGFATEAATFLLSYAFEVLDQPHVISLIHPDDAPSRRAARG